MDDRYQTGVEGAFEPGSSGRVLRNKLGLTDPADCDEVELVLLQKLYHEVLQEDLPDRKLSVTDLKTLMNVAIRR